MMRLPQDHETIAGIGRRLREGEMTCLDLLRSCLDRIEEREPQVRAWVVVDKDGAEAQARALDAELAAGQPRGPLHGIPIGIKDIIDVKGLPTRCGSPRATDRAALADAPLVERLREAGAVILGKTVTTAWAWIDPPITRNPWNPDRTPGGSSSGSAAAVASGMCMGAIGTQTGGSIIRPAAFCGIAGMKPTFGLVSTSGIQPFAPSLDHPGPLALFVADLYILYQVIRDPGNQVEDKAVSPTPSAKDTPRLGRLGGFFDRLASAEMQAAIHAFLKWFKAWGADVIEVSEPVDFEELRSCHRTIMAAEAAATHKERFALLPEAFPPRIAELIREGQAISPTDYRLARDLKADRLERVLALFNDVDALVTPAALGAAPETSTTGDPAFNSPWSYLGLPTVSFPLGFSAERLPLSVQLIGKPNDDLKLLRMAEWCETVTRSAH
jgi:aspartyl-tRNA(Asn)/glutamyl-tRNA(Gln) amidotransferase subunit A